MERFSSEFRGVFSTAELLDNIEKSGATSFWVGRLTNGIPAETRLRISR